MFNTPSLQVKDSKSRRPAPPIRGRAINAESSCGDYKKGESIFLQSYFAETIILPPDKKKRLLFRSLFVKLIFTYVILLTSFS